MKKVYIALSILSIATASTVISCINNDIKSEKTEVEYRDYINKTDSTPEFLRYIIQDENKGKSYRDIKSIVKSKKEEGTEIQCQYLLNNDTTITTFIIKGNRVNKQ